MRAILSLFGAGGGSNAAPFPYDLASAIELASVTERGEIDPENGPRIYVRCAGLGHFRWQGIEDAATRVLRGYHELSERQAKRAADLLAIKVGSAHRAAFRGERARRGSKFAPPPLPCDFGYDR